MMTMNQRTYFMSASPRLIPPGINQYYRKDRLLAQDRIPGAG
jgi:hypothetical protein